MALATNTTPGEIHLDGDLHISNPLYPELRPTGVHNGNYVFSTIDVDSKGLLTSAIQPPVDIESLYGFATNISLGVCQFGSRITDEGSGVFNVPLSVDDATFGVIRSADLNNITITAGEIDVGTNVVQFDTAGTFSSRSKPTISSNVLTPNLAVSNIFEKTLTTNSTLQTPTNAEIGDVFSIIIDTAGFTLTTHSNYKIRSDPSIAEGVSVFTCVCVSVNTFYTILQTNFI